MYSHNFSLGKQRDAVSGEEYYKCKNCGAVMFDKNDNWFNLACQVPANDRENIRERLRNA